MIIFKKRNEDIYLLTNYKVMYTNLTYQKNLVNVRPGKRIYLHAVMSWISPSSKFYLIVRNPFKRIVSFYKSKFKSAEHNRKWMLQNEKGGWQKCTEYFFPYLGLNKNMDSKVVSKKLSSTQFEEVVSILPNVFLMDGHMKPQYLALKFSIIKWGYKFFIPIKFEKIFKIEIEPDLKELEKIFNIDLSKKINSTKDVIDDKVWNNDSIKVVAKLYEKDFKKFNYCKSFPF